VSKYSVIGKRLPRVDAAVKVTGETKYTFDMALPGMLFAAILRSPYPHARIMKIDTARAERLAGVKAVVTGREMAGNGMRPGVDCGMAINHVHYVGEGVVAVAAIDNDTAMEALNLIDVVYEELPAIFDPEEALRPGAPRANTDLKDNIMVDVAYHWGDVEKGFRQCDHIRQDRLTTQSVHNAYMEPFAAIASFDTNGKLTYWISSQEPQGTRMVLAERLGIKLGDVRVIVPYVGGAHCGKGPLAPFMVVPAVLSRKSCRPVKLVLYRNEVLIENRGMPPIITELKTGVKKDGTLIAMDCRMIAAAGPYLSAEAAIGKGAFALSYLFATALNLPYRLPNIRYEGYTVHTNHSNYFAQRGSGNTPARFAYESHLDMIAADLGLDPVEIRKRNALQSGDITANKCKISTSGLAECLQKVTERTNWKERKGKLGNNRGLGIACYAHPTGPMPEGMSASAFVHVHADGTVTLIVGATELGQGIATVMSQIVAEVLGLPLEDVRMSQLDTEVCPYAPGTMGSVGTYVIGSAVKLAADDARRQILQLAAKTLGARVEALEMAQRAVYVRDKPEKSLSFSTLFRDAKPILGRGRFISECKPPNLETGEGTYTPNHSFGAVVAEVEVDRETGQVKVMKGTLAHDCGFALNPTLVEGQIEGQFQAGTGQAIYEERLMEKGYLLNPTFTDYRMPRSLDMPQVEAIIVETVDPKGPFGAKECGEGPQGGVAPAIANAVYDAIGVRIRDLPITPEKVLKALKEKGG
jgi:4-hydroxybenzoyl-CoA reductase subunit alpha